MRTLILCKCDDGCFGIWQNGRILRLKASDLHWLPSDCPHLAGLSIINNRSITLFDLPAAIGLTPVDRHAEYFSVLLFQHRAVSAGLLLPRHSRKGRVDPKVLRPLPDFLASAVQQFWLPTAGGPIPVIDTVPLLKTIQRQTVSPLKPAFALQDQRLPEWPPPERFCRIRTGNYVFAVPSGPLAFRPARSLAVHPVAMAPAHVSGMTVVGRHLLPVLQPAKMMQLPDPGAVEEVLITRVNDALFGFEIEGRPSCRGDGRLTLTALSGVLHKPWMPAVCRADGDLLPFLDLAALLARHGHPDSPVNTDNRPPTPGNADFAAAWGRAAVEVFIFDLCGHKLGLPKCEVVDVRPFVPPRPIPVQNRLVTGMILWDDDIVAVLDPAACFGLRSRARPDWHLIRVKTGSGEVCIMAETVGGALTLGPNRHRDLPYKDTHGVLYGCCPERGRVRLIFDVQALLDLFDNDDRIGSPPLFQAVPDLKPHTGAPFEPVRSIEPVPERQSASAPKAGRRSEPIPPKTDTEPTQSTLASETAALEKPADHADVKRQVDRGAPLPALLRERAVDLHPAMAALLEPVTRLALADDLESLPLPAKPVAALMAPEAEKSIETAKPSHSKPPSALPPTDRPSEIIELPQEPTGFAIPKDSPCPNRFACKPGALQPGDNHAVAASAAVTGLPFLPAPRDLLPIIDSDPNAPVNADAARYESPAVAETGIDAHAPLQKPQPIDIEAVQTVSETKDAEAQPTADTVRQRPTRWKAYVLAAILFCAGAAGILWLTLDAHWFGGEHGLSVTRRIRNSLTPDGTANGAAPAKGRPNPATEASEKTADGTTYRVREGDTLWGISEKFTGSGFNYDRLAQDNDIEDPNVIFPSQQIEVK